MSQIQQHRAIQVIAKKVLAQIESTLSPSDSERSIAIRAQRLLADCGVTQTWYYDCPALVLAGTRTCLSMSGKDYVPADNKIGSTSLVSVDLSPTLDGIWGDCARSFYVEDGVAVSDPQNTEFKCGREALRRLHANLLRFATPETTFEELWGFASSEVKALECMTLDFLGNFGHTIESESESRSYIEAGNSRLLKDTELFTFEPHIKTLQGIWGFKHEEIYYFDNDAKLQVL